MTKTAVRMTGVWPFFTRPLKLAKAMKALSRESGERSQGEARSAKAISTRPDLSRWSGFAWRTRLRGGSPHAV